MKKYTVFALILVFAFVLFGFRAGSVSASNCAPGDLFNSTSGKPCNSSTTVECPVGDIFSAITGQACTTWKNSTTTTTSTTDLKIGSRGDVVKVFQQKLIDAGFLIGKADGIYGPKTDAAAKNYYVKFPPSTVPPTDCPLTTDTTGAISHNCNPLPTPCPAGTTATGITASMPGKYICTPISNSSITVTTPNGGEKWATGTTQTIKWQDNIASVDCGGVTGCTGVQKSYEIKLNTYYPPCTTSICPMSGAYRMPFTLAKVQGSSYAWQVGKAQDGTAIPAGLYQIEVCQFGTNTCDTSDNSFEITSATAASGLLSVTPERATLQVGDTATFQAIYNSCPLGSGMQCFVGPMPVNATWVSGDTKVATVSYKNACPTGTVCKTLVPDYSTVVVTAIGVGSTTLTASYNGNSFVAAIRVVSIPTGTTSVISSLSPNSGPIGTQVTIKGIGFTPTGNKIRFGNLGSENNPVYNLSSTDGTSLVFNVPSSNYFACWDSPVTACKIAAVMTQPGIYGVSVVNANGISNVVNFTVTGTATVTSCDYPAPPAGYHYVSGPHPETCDSYLVPDSTTIPTNTKVLGAESFHFTLLLKLGSRGNEVIELQKFLNTAGYNLGTPDGNFGPKTEAALVKFQIANKLTGDGIVGPMVRAILNK